MLIKEVEKITGITSKNIRFYEKEGLLSPSRNVENRYRDYSDEDVRRLKEIKLLRKFGIGLLDIKSIQDGSLPLGECLEKYLNFFAQQKKELEKVIELCAEIQKNETCLPAIDTDFYLNKINSAECGGATFVDIAKDFITKAKSVIPAHSKLFFEPNEPVMDRFDFARELEQYAENKGLSLTFITMGMNPVILLDGKRYRCQLEMPRFLHLPFPLSLFFVSRYTFHFRWIYLYDEDAVNDIQDN